MAKILFELALKLEVALIVFQFFPFGAQYLTPLYTLLYIIYNKNAKFKVTKIL